MAVNKQILGKVVIINKGEYNSSNTYEILDVVSYKGSSYLSKIDNNTSVPTDNEKWQLIAKKGDMYEVTEEDLQTIAKQITDDANSIFNTNVDSKTNNFNDNAEEKLSTFNTNASTKLNDYNSNAKTKLDDYNANDISKSKAYNDNATSALEVFNTNASTKLTAYNDNATEKLAAYNDNAKSALKAYNDNATTKTNTFDINAENKTDAFNTNAQTKVDEFNSTANVEKITNLSNEFYRVKDNILETGEATDTYIHLEDSALAEMQELEVEGVCEQTTTTGKNKLDTDKIEVGTKNGVTLSYNSKTKEITLNGTCTTDNTFFKISQLFTYDGTYTLSYECVSGSFTSTTNKPTILLLNSSSYNGLSLYFLSNAKKQSYTNTFNFTAGYNGIRVDADTTFNNYTIKMQLEKNSTATEWEPYTNEVATPSPDYPQEIKTITGNLNLTSCNKNLFKMNDNYLKGYTTTRNGITLKVEDDLSISLKGTATARTEFFLIGSWGVKNNNYLPKKVLTLSQSGLVDGITSNFAFFKNGINVLNKGLTYIITSQTFDLSTADFDGMSFAISIGNNKTIDTRIYTQLEKNSTQTSFEQHIQSQITANLPEGEFIGKINGTYKDILKLEYHEDDGRYHLVLNKMVGKVVLDGSENWILSTNGFILGVAEVYKHFKRNLNVFNGICNYFLVGTTSVAWGTNNYCGWNIAGVFWIREDHKLATTVEDFKTWLSTHNTEVYYVLATPYEVDLGVVDMPLSYDEITNIFTDSDLLPSINAKYYRNFTKTIQNLQVNEKALKEELIDINNRLTALENANTSTTDDSEVTEE